MTIRDPTRHRISKPTGAVSSSDPSGGYCTLRVVLVVTPHPDYTNSLAICIGVIACNHLILSFRETGASIKHYFLETHLTFYSCLKLHILRTPTLICRTQFCQDAMYRLTGTASRTRVNRLHGMTCNPLVIPLCECHLKWTGGIDRR